MSDPGHFEIHSAARKMIYRLKETTKWYGQGKGVCSLMRRVPLGQGATIDGSGESFTFVFPPFSFGIGGNAAPACACG